MPVEIKELVIRAVAQPTSSGAGAAPAETGRGSASLPDEATIEACVKEVLRILRRSKER